MAAVPHGHWQTATFIAAAGAAIRYLPHCSPDPNPYACQPRSTAGRHRGLTAQGGGGQSDLRSGCAGTQLPVSTIDAAMALVICNATWSPGRRAAANSRMAGLTTTD